MAPNIVIYTKDYCPYCKAAKALFKKKGISYMNHEISDDPVRRLEMIERSGGRTTVPQIFIGDVHIGGHSDLVRVNRSGRLDALLRSAAA